VARVRVDLPSVLSTVVGGAASVEIEAETLEGALRALVRALPALETHLFDETGDFRRHVLCFHNRTNSRWLESRAVPLAEGDTISILQAVSGG
jgi:molybdopterin converting factor small subunit